MKHDIIELADGHKVGVTTSEGDRPLVFIHGFTVNRRVYDPMLELLAEGGYQVIAIDLAGHGDTESLPRGHSFEDLVSLVIEACYELGVHSAVFVGHSLGGRVAAQIAADTNLAEKVILMSAAVGQPFDDYENQHIALKLAMFPVRAAMAVLDTALDGPGNPWDAGVYYAKMASAVASSWPGFLRVGWAVTHGVDTIVPLDTIRHRRVPAAVIHGDRDLVIPVGCAESAADTAGCRLFVVNDAYHSWMISDPDRGARSLLKVLAVTR